MLKTKNEFLDHFARLGVFSKVQALMDDGNDSENSMDVVIKSSITSVSTSSGHQSTSVSLSQALTDATPSSSTSSIVVATGEPKCM